MKKRSDIILAVIVVLCAVVSLITLAVSIYQDLQAGEGFPWISLVMTLVTVFCAAMVCWRTYKGKDDE